MLRNDFACGDYQGQTSFQCEYAIEATDAVADVEGLGTIQITGSDAGGNLVVGELSQSVYLDFTPPTVRESGSFFTPSLARAGERVELTLAFDEDVQDSAILLEFRGADGEPVSFFGEGTPWLHEVTAQDVNGVYSAVVDVVDGVGNRATQLGIPGSFEIDTASPAVTLLNVADVNTVTYSAQGDQTDLTLEVCVSDSDVRPQDLVTSIPADGCEPHSPLDEAAAPCGSFFLAPGVGPPSSVNWGSSSPPPPSRFRSPMPRETPERRANFSPWTSTAPTWQPVPFLRPVWLR